MVSDGMAIISLDAHSYQKPHSHLRDLLYYIISHLSPLANLTPSDLSMEASGILSSFPTIQPTGICIK
jgi:hypothetical protein